MKRRPKSREEAERERKIRNTSMFKVFTGQANPQQAKVARETLALICKVDEPTQANGLDGLVELAVREGMRRVYLQIVECIHLGQSEGEEIEWLNRGSSEGGNDSA